MSFCLHHVHIICKDLEKMIGFFTNDLKANLVRRKKFGTADGASLELRGAGINLRVAKADEKMAAMEAVLAELVSQRKEMREKFADMHHQKAMCGMMGKGGRHGKMGRGGGMKGMNPNCPMMGGMQQGPDDQGGQKESAKPETKN